MNTQATTPHDKLMQAISIMQSVYLARDSATSGDAVFGGMFMPDTAIELAVNLCCEILPDLERLERLEQ